MRALGAGDWLALPIQGLRRLAGGARRSVCRVCVCVYVCARARVLVGMCVCARVCLCGARAGACLCARGLQCGSHWVCVRVLWV